MQSKCRFLLDITPLRSPAEDYEAEPSRVSTLETCESDLHFLCSALHRPKDLRLGDKKWLVSHWAVLFHRNTSGWGCQVTCIPTYFTRIGWIIQLACAPSSPHSASSVRWRAGNFHYRESHKSSNVVYWPFLLLGFPALNSWQNMRKNTEQNSWKIKFTTSQESIHFKELNFTEWVTFVEAQRYQNVLKRRD